ncbi:DUF6188 family protein [Kitasatospora camelliae]|uniref:DUF6188 family protein n=1 Tax=Kitasatospora camelliae TaxID=3156397 RepID=A0AAU8JQT1_9ACTN
MANPIDAALRGRRVERVRGGRTLVLELTGRIAVVVANDLRVSSSRAVEHYYPGLSPAPTGGLARLVGVRVAATVVTPAGGLELHFDTGQVLSVPPDTAAADGTEPWRVTGPDGPMFTALPGGYLTA